MSISYITEEKEEGLGTLCANGGSAQALAAMRQGLDCLCSETVKPGAA